MAETKDEGQVTAWENKDGEEDERKSVKDSEMASEVSSKMEELDGAARFMQRFAELRDAPFK